MSQMLLNKLRTTNYTTESSEEYNLYELIVKIRCDDTRPEPNFMEILDSVVKNHNSDSRNVGRNGWNIWKFLNDNIEVIDKCEDCYGLDYSDDMIHAYDENPICHNCRDNYMYSDSRDMYVSHEEYEDEDYESDRDEYIY